MAFLTFVVSLLFASIDPSNPTTVENPPGNEMNCSESEQGNNYIIVDMYNP